MYKNQSVIDEAKKQLSNIDPEIKIEGYTLDYKDRETVIRLEIRFPTKGKSEVIKSLEKLGWKRWFREKARTDNDSYSRCQYDGYVMYQRMSLDI